MNDKEIKRFVNKIFEQKGVPKVKNFAREFSDGILFEALFNILYDERINCYLTETVLLDQKILNWNRINASICFNYLQQKFYLLKPTMKSLSSGKNEEVILKLLRNLISSTQGNQFETYLDDEGIRDIADVLKSNKGVY